MMVCGCLFDCFGFDVVLWAVVVTDVCKELQEADGKGAEMMCR